MERVQTEGLTGGEGSLDATDIYPSRVGSVTTFEQVKGEAKDKHPLFAFTDTSIPATLDYTQCLIPNQPLTIAFQSGMLAGQTFEAEYTHKDRRFTIIGKEVDGVWMPEAPYIAKVGDKYAVFSVELPAPYIRDNNTKTGAEWELLRRALKHLHEATQHPYVYRADLDGLWAKKDWTNRGGAIRLGGYVRLSDPELIPYGVDLRITGIKDYLISPETPEIELGTGVSASSILTTIEQMRQEGARQEEAVKEVRQEGSRNYEQALEASKQIARATAERFSSSISPATIKTMQLIAGDPQTQLRFKTPENWTPEYNKDTQVLRLPAGQIEWLYNPSRTLSSSEAKAGKVWALPEMRTPALPDPNKSYYIYARCNNGVGASLAGAFVVDTNPRELNDGSATCLLLGLLSSADETGARSFSRLYGFTEILPSQIRTERITSADGSTTINLQTGEIVSDKIKFRHPDGGEKSYPSDYLHEAIKEGSTEISGGLVLGSIIGAKNSAGAVASYLSGVANLPAFAAGVTNFGKPNEARVVAINHDGTGHWGQMEVMEGGKVVQIGSMRFGGKLPNTYTQDLRTLEFNDPRHERSRTYIGDDGALFFFGMWGATPRFVRISNQLNKPVLQVRGDVDISGSLLGGRVYAGNVSFEHKWGARSDRMSIRRKETGIYIVTHDLGHTRYSVLCMDAGNGRHNAKAGKITANSFEIYTKYDNTLYSDIDFTFYVFGDNY